MSWNRFLHPHTYWPPFNTRWPISCWEGGLRSHCDFHRGKDAWQVTSLRGGLRLIAESAQPGRAGNDGIANDRFAAINSCKVAIDTGFHFLYRWKSLHRAPRRGPQWSECHRIGGNPVVECDLHFIISG